MGALRRGGEYKRTACVWDERVETEAHKRHEGTEIRGRNNQEENEV